MNFLKLTPVCANEFDEVADEYYDPLLHPTCANFDQASRLLINRWLSVYPFTGVLCDVGCGRSLLAEILEVRQAPFGELVLIDQSPAMLEHSRQWERIGATLHVGAAENLPLAPKSCDLVVSSLGDPYNKPPFWREAARVLKHNRRLFFTIPSHDWAAAYRRQFPPDRRNSAEFELRSGKRIWLPSYIYDPLKQIEMIEEAGLRVERTDNITIADLSAERLSAKLGLERGATASVVAGYVATKL